MKIKQVHIEQTAVHLITAILVLFIGLLLQFVGSKIFNGAAPAPSDWSGYEMVLNALYYFTLLGLGIVLGWWIWNKKQKRRWLDAATLETLMKHTTVARSIYEKLDASPDRSCVVVGKEHALGVIDFATWVKSIREAGPDHPYYKMIGPEPKPKRRSPQKSTASKARPKRRSTPRKKPE